MMVEYMDGKVFHQGTDEYKEWYDGKLEEYNQTHNGFAEEWEDWVDFDKSLTMVFGGANPVFKKFDDEHSEYTDFLNKHNGKVNLTYDGFAEEWEDWVDFDKSYAYIDNGKLYVVVYGLPEHLNRRLIVQYFGNTLEHYIKQGYGELFETEPGCPICMIVERDGKEVTV